MNATYARWFGRGVATAILALAGGISFCQAGTIAFWQFEPGAGFLNDSSSNNYTLTNFNNTVTSATGSGNFAPDAPGSTGSASFTGSQDMIGSASGSPLNLSGTSELTFEWFMKTSQTGIAMLFEQGTNFNSRPGAPAAYINESGNDIRASLGTTGGALRQSWGNLSVNDGNWHHIAVTYEVDTVNNTKQVQFFLDGALKSVASTLQDNGTVHAFLNERFFIGFRANTVQGSLHYNGLIDDFRISDTVLTPSQFLNAVPEPSSFAMLLFGSAMLWAVGRKKKGCRH